MNRNCVDSDGYLKVVFQEAKDISMVAICRRLIKQKEMDFLGKTGLGTRQRAHAQREVKLKTKIKLLQEAQSKYSRILSNIGNMLSSRESKGLSPLNLPIVLLFDNVLFHNQARWGYDPTLDRGKVDPSLYFMNKYTQITHFLSNNTLGRSCIRRSLTDIFNKHGYCGALTFLQRIWDDCWILDPRHCAELKWEFIRGGVFSLQNPRSEEQYLFAGLHRSNKTTDILFRRAAHIDRKLGRDSRLLAEKVARMRLDVETKLHRARSKSTDFNDWLKRIFSILPTYLAILYLYKELYYSSGNEKIRKNLSQEMRLVDERQADIQSTVSSAPGAILHAYSEALNALYEGDITKGKGILKFYCRGRIFYPEYFYKELEARLGLAVPEVMHFFFNELSKGFRRAFELLETLAGLPHISDIVSYNDRVGKGRKDKRWNNNQ